MDYKPKNKLGLKGQKKYQILGGPCLTYIQSSFELKAQIISKWGPEINRRPNEV